MAGESRITLGVGRSFDGAFLRTFDGYFEDGFQYESYFDSERLRFIEPFHGVKDDSFAVVALSTLRWGDPQEWDYPYGIQKIGTLSFEDLEAFAVLQAALEIHHPKLAQSASELGVIISVTADI